MTGRGALRENMTIFGAEAVESMRGRTAGLVGLGSLGSVGALLMSRLPLKKLVLVDRDIVEKKNLHRQYLYTEADAEELWPKAEAARRRLESSSETELESRDIHLDAENAGELFEECDLVLDATDNFETRLLLNEASVFYGKPWIYGGILGTRGSVMFVGPRGGPCLRCVFEEVPAVGAEESCDTAGIHPALPMIIASIQASEAAKYLSGDEASVEKRLIHFDIRTMRLVKIDAVKNPECPVCGARKFGRLEGGAGNEIRELCGGESVLVILKGRKFDLRELEKRLGTEGRVFSNGYILSFEQDGIAMTIHGDGRVLVRGIGEGGKAMSHVSRALGL